jgi:uncharacterized protein YjdB
VDGITVTGTGGATAITTDNGTIQLSAAISPYNATDKTVIWSIINDTGQATINSTGRVTAIDNGNVTAWATAHDGSGVYGTMLITITNQIVPVTGIIVKGANGVTAITADRRKLQLETAILPSNATDRTVTWSIVNGAGLATISTTGVVKAIDNGIVTAKATANDGSGISGLLDIPNSLRIPN